MINDRVREIVIQQGQLPVDAAQVSDNADLYALGLSSLRTVNIMLALEDEFDVEFPDESLSRRTFESVLSIAEAIEDLVDS